MKILTSILFIFILSMIANAPTHAAFVIAGTHELLPNQAAQVIEIFAAPSVPGIGETISGLNLNLVIDDGGSVVGGSDNNAPRITAVNLKPVGGLFANIADAQTVVFPSQKLYQVTIASTNVVNRPVLNSNTLLAQITVTTVGLISGSWLLDLDGIPSRGLPSSDFVGTSTTITNGLVSIPEPSCLSLLTLVSLLAIGLFGRRRVNEQFAH